MKKGFLMAVFFIGVTLFAIGAANAAQAPDMPDVFPAFSAQNLNGGSVTNTIFEDKKLTMVNIWTTWCPPCINEMPDLGRLGRSMPEGTQLVGIVLDARDPKENSETIDNAKSILKKTYADFLQILPVEEMAPVLEEVAAIPTTIFVNSKGHIVGNALVGSRPEEAYRSEIEKILKSMK